MGREELLSNIKSICIKIDEMMKTNPYGNDIFKVDELIGIINESDENSLRKFCNIILSMYGGMGSFGDYVLEKGDNLDFDKYRTKLYELVSELKKSIT